MQKIIVITGASGGVGSMLALGLAKNGNHVVCLGRRREPLVKLTREIDSQTERLGGGASFEVVDMMQADAVKPAGERIIEKHGRIDVWINNVGVNNHDAIGPAWEVSPENWWNEVSSNLFTAYLGTTTAINLMKENGVGYVLNLGGGGAQEAKPFASAYGTAKTGVVKFTEIINLELEKSGSRIRTFAFNPGFIRNERTEKLVESDVCKKYLPKLGEIMKHGKMSKIEDSISLIETLISGRADALGGRYFLADDRNIEQLIREYYQA